ncbi:predicted protein, partial [Nematostella vectensis]
MLIVIWDFIEDAVIRVLEGHSDVIEDISFSPNNNATIASASRDRTIRLWKNWLYPETTECSTLLGHEARVTCCVYSPLNDGRLLSASADRTIRVWD